MIMYSENGNEFELRVIDYEYTQPENQFGDDWLQMYVRGKCEVGGWEVEDPCLTAEELKELHDWIYQIHSRKAERYQLSFTEQCLYFELIGEEADAAVIRIYFTLECRPHWCQENDVPFAFMDMILTTEAMFLALKQLEKQIERFPVRKKY